MKILFLSAEYPPETGGGGIGSYVASIARPLSERGHEVHVLSCVPGQMTSDSLIDGVWIHRRGVIRDKNIWAWAQILNSYLTLPRLYAALTCFIEARRLPVHFDVVEAPDWMAEGLLFGLLRNAPLVGHLHTGIGLATRFNGDSLGNDVKLANKLEQIAIARSHVVTSPSKLLVRELESIGWTRTGSVEIVRVPVDFERWRDVTPVEETKPVVLAVGRLEPLKAPEVLIRALGHLGQDIADLQAIFVGDENRSHGDSTYGTWLTSLANEAGVACRLVGKIPRDELSAWYGAARVVAVPSMFESFSMAALEGMAAGRPVVCTSSVGAGELLRGSKAGKVIAPADPKALADALRPFLLSTSAAVTAGREARDLVLRHCSPALIAEEREAIYARAIDKWNRSPSGRLRRLLS